MKLAGEGHEAGWQRPRDWLAEAMKLAGKGHGVGWRRPRSWLAKAAKLAGKGDEVGFAEAMKLAGRGPRGWLARAIRFAGKARESFGLRQRLSAGNTRFIFIETGNWTFAVFTYTLSPGSKSTRRRCLLTSRSF
jgi:hypothetical protein